MTEPAVRTAPRQALIDTISKARAPAVEAQARSRSSKSAQQPSNLSNTPDLGRSRSNPRLERNRSSDREPVETVAKTAAKPLHQSDKDGDRENSFETTIDKLGAQATPDATATSSPANTTPATWNNLAVQQQPQQPMDNTGSGDANAPEIKSASHPGRLLKQESVAALLDARQRLLTAQDRGDLPADAMIEETVTPATVNSRETHWAFDKVTAASSTRTAETLKASDVQASLLANGTTTQSKAPADALSRLAVQPTDITVANDASPQQNFDGTQNGRQGAREQAHPKTGEARIADASASAPADRIARHLSDAAEPLPAPIQQVRSGILTALKGEPGGAPMPNPPQAIDRPSQAGQVLRSIDLTLSPPDLGTVRLKLSLRASVLDIDAEASKAATAKMLDDDRQGLEKSLRDAGYDVKSLKITEASSTANSGLNTSLNNSGSTFQDGNQARTNFAGRQDDGNMQRQGGGTSDQSQQHARDNKRQAAPGTDLGSARQANGIYI